MYLGVDGGGTKTAFCLLDADGKLRAQATTDSVYYLIKGIGIVEPLLAEGVTAVCREAGIKPEEIAYAFFGLPCYGEVSADVPVLDELPSRVLGHGRYGCGNDMICGWAGSLGGVDGINVVAGTGSIAYGESGGTRKRIGGWGEVFGDEGSGYWVATRGLNAFSRMADGRLPRGPLAELMRDALGLDADLDAIDVVLNRWKGDRGRVAALSRVVAAAADAGDEAATGILRDAGRELALLANALRMENLPISYSGGMFTNPLLLESFKTTLHGQDLREPLFPPHLGAALYAARLAGKTITM
jgi:N-acetylglucosamine kinase-like BadF-type ATPase